MWGPDVHQIPPNVALKQFTFAFTLFGGIMLLSYFATPSKPVVPREYPFDGLVKELGGLEENKVMSLILPSHLGGRSSLQKKPRRLTLWRSHFLLLFFPSFSLFSFFFHTSVSGATRVVRDR